MGKRLENINVNIEEVNAWVADQISFCKASQESLSLNESLDAGEKNEKNWTLKGNIESLELVYLMLNGMYCCDYCAGKHTSCESKEDRAVCSLYTFSAEALKEACEEDE